MLNRTLICAASLCTALCGQTTWIVNAGGGAGVNFTDLPSAVAAASDGDTIIVQTGPFLEGASPFTTSKGLTIVGEGGFVPIGTSPGNPIVVDGLPATSSFRMVGFDRPFNGALDVRIRNCQGLVHLGQLRCREHGPFFPTEASIEIVDSPHVTLRDVTNFGSPAVQIDNSDVQLIDCRLGVTHIGIGGGQWITATDSTVDVFQPSFDAGPGVPAGIEATNSALRIGGHVSAEMVNPGGAIVHSNGGSVIFDPGVAVVSGPNAFTGTGSINTMLVTGSITSAPAAGTTLAIETFAPAGMGVFQILGFPGPRLATPFGDVGMELGLGFAFFPGQVVPSGSFSVTSNLPVPAAVARGSAFTTQALVLTGQLQLALPVTFVVH